MNQGGTERRPDSQDSSRDNCRCRDRELAEPARLDETCLGRDGLPVAAGVGRNPAMEFRTQDFVDVDHRLTSSSFFRKVWWAALSVADTVPTSIPSTSAIAR